jgi:hypothetical protein
VILANELGQWVVEFWQIKLKETKRTMWLSHGT